MADGVTSLGSLRWGSSTGGAAVAADDTTTLGVDRQDTRTPPDLTRIWAASGNAVKNAVIAIGQTHKSGTRLGTATQSASPFGATEQGLWIDTSGVLWFSYGGTNYRIGVAAGGAVTQATNVNTGVTLNAMSGVITTQSASTGTRAAESGFTVTNSFVTTSSAVIARVVAYSGTLFTNGQPDVDVTAVANGSFNIRVINRDATNPLSGTMKIHFIVQ